MAMTVMRGLAKLLVLLALTITPPISGGSSAQTGDSHATGQSSQKEKLEVQKLDAEIGKLHFDESTGLIVPALSAISILVLAVSLIVQRQTALGIQTRSDQTNLELKVADLLMSSSSPAAAEARMNVLNALYGDRLRPGFKGRFDKEDFHGPRFHELRLEVFKQVSAKASSPDEIAQIFVRVFPNEHRIQGEIIRNPNFDVLKSEVGSQSSIT